MAAPIYLDYAATTPISPTVKAAVNGAVKCAYNPSSAHVLGQTAARMTEQARVKCAHAINASPKEIIFTSGGTEAIALAFNSVRYGSKKHIVVSAIEHDAALANARLLAEYGFNIDYLYPNEHGIITADALKAVITDDTALVCIMTVNNIVGSIQPIESLVQVAHENGALFFTDAVQAVNSVHLDVKKTNVDMLCVSAHKFYAPKGVGFLYVKSGVKIAPLIVGGEQENGLRAGTQNVCGIVGMGEGIAQAVQNMQANNARLKTLRSLFLQALGCGKVIECDPAVAEIFSVVFDGINGGRLAVAASCAGICISVGSACSAGSATVPPTLAAMKVPNADCAVRISLGAGMSDNIAKCAGLELRRVVQRLSQSNS